MRDRTPWHESGNPTTVVRGGSWRAGVWIVCAVVFFGLIGAGVWGGEPKHDQVPVRPIVRQAARVLRHQGQDLQQRRQAGPELENIRPCSGCEHVVVDSAQDDGSYGNGDPGIFFFTVDGTMVVTSLDYIQSDQPIPFDVPQLRK